MTETEKKALALLNEVRAEQRITQGSTYVRSDAPFHEALCRAIEAHEAFRQEVSDAVEDYFATYEWPKLDSLTRFIIPKPKPDPLTEFMIAMKLSPDEYDTCREALAKRGLEIREIGND